MGRHLFDHLSGIPAIEVQLLSSRTLDGLRADADLALLTVADSAVEPVAERLESFGGTLAHTSGSVPLSALGRQSRAGVLYPFQSFAEGVPVDFSEVPLLVQATDRETMDALLEIASALGGPLLQADDVMRRELHLAGVLSCNFVNELLASAQSRLKEAGMSPGLLEPLVRLTIEKALRFGAENVRTGPAVRRDMATIGRHLEMLTADPALAWAYAAMTNLTQDRTEQTPPATQLHSGH